MTLEDNINRLLLADDTQTKLDYIGDNTTSPWFIWISDNAAKYLPEAGFNLVALYERGVALSPGQGYSVPDGIKELGYNFMIAEKARGTSFPSNPVSGQLFFRDDRGILYRFDGVNWLCTCPHYSSFIPMYAINAAFTTSQGSLWRWYHPGQYDIYIPQIIFNHFHSGTFSNTEKYTQKLVAWYLNQTSTNIVSADDYKSGRVANTNYKDQVVIGGRYNYSDHAFMEVGYTKVGSNVTSGFGAQQPVIEYFLIG